MTELDSRLGISATIFHAGCTTVDLHQRVAAIDASDVVFGWYPDRNDSWWADIVYASQAGRRLVIAESGNTVYETGAGLLWRIKGHVAHGVPTKEDGALLARAFAAHDPGAKSGAGQYSDQLCALLKNCESPIEARLLLHLYESVTSGTACDLFGQRELLDGAYRADFVITNERLEGEPESWRREMGYSGPIRVVVETDGHEWHERSKEQAARDKRRDRDLQIAGWKVLRFTGSEVWRDPIACREQIIECLRSLGGAF